MKLDRKFKRRLNKLACFLDTIPRRNFDLTCVVATDDLPTRDVAKCGAAACAVGWCPIVFPRSNIFFDKPDSWSTIDVEFPDGTNLLGACDFFGLTFDQGHYLFTPDSYDNYNPEPKEVAERIRKLMSSGLPKDFERHSDSAW